MARNPRRGTSSSFRTDATSPETRCAAPGIADHPSVLFDFKYVWIPIQESCCKDRTAFQPFHNFAFSSSRGKQAAPTGVSATCDGCDVAFIVS